MKSIWAVGRNYEEHAKELGNAPATAGSPPLIFLKSGGTVVANSREVRLPTWSSDVHHEAEVALRLKVTSNGKISFDAFTIALDLTARDFQAQLKKAGQPWTLAKSFKDSCPLGDWVSAAKLGRTDGEIFKGFEQLEFALKINGEVRQHGFTRDMVHSVENMLAYLSERFPVQDGDVLLTGTPEGVSAIKAGDQALAEIIGFTKANWKFV